MNTHKIDKSSVRHTRAIQRDRSKRPSSVAPDAEVLDRSLSEISMEMVYRGLYHFTYAYQDGKYTDPVKFLVDKAKL